MYLGLSPFEAPAVYSLLPYTELAEDGLWFPEGGMYSLIEAMERLATELGVTFHLNSRVEEVVVSKGKRRRVGGEEIWADAVLAERTSPTPTASCWVARRTGTSGSAAARSSSTRPRRSCSTWA